MSATTLLLPWHDGFAVGIPELDADHHGMVDLINAIADAWQGADATLALEGFDLLYRLSEAHLTREEAILAGLFPDHSHADHKAAHLDCLQQLDALKTRLVDLPAGTQYTAVAAELADWFVAQSAADDASFRGTDGPSDRLRNQQPVTKRDARRATPSSPRPRAAQRPASPQG